MMSLITWMMNSAGQQNRKALMQCQVCVLSQLSTELWRVKCLHLLCTNSPGDALLNNLYHEEVDPWSQYSVSPSCVPHPFCSHVNSYSVLLLGLGAFYM